MNDNLKKNNWINKILKIVKNLFQGKYGKGIITAIISILIIGLSISTTSYVNLKNEYKNESNQLDIKIIELRDSIKSNVKPIFNYKIHLNVTDQSKYVTKLNFNKGVIVNPSTKTYILIVDSSSVEFKPDVINK